MKKLLIAALLATSLPTLAADLIDHKTEKPIAGNQADIQVLNFWATYCVPCRKEMPEMNRWFQKVKAQKSPKIELAGIAIDSKDNINNFLKTTPVSYPIWRYTGKNSRAFMKTYGNKIGVLPYTMVRAPKCGKEQAIVGEVDGKKLDQTIKAVWAQCKK
ncbi:TlpA family protein disulfide reductase [Neisseriaceae bacterium B1]